MSISFEIESAAGRTGGGFMFLRSKRLTLILSSISKKMFRSCRGGGGHVQSISRHICIYVSISIRLESYVERRCGVRIIGDLSIVLSFYLSISIVLSFYLYVNRCSVLLVRQSVPWCARLYTRD